jgi:hypothetical protein
MSSWGRNVDVQLTGTGTIDANTNVIVGTNTVFTEEVEIRNVVALDDQSFVVLNIVDDETLQVEPISGLAEVDQDILLSETPKYLSVTDATQNAVYVTVDEAQDANNRILGLKTPGWTLYEEYGNGRKRVETLVAMKSTSTS